MTIFDMQQVNCAMQHILAKTRMCMVAFVFLGAGCHCASDNYVRSPEEQPDDRTPGDSSPYEEQMPGDPGYEPPPEGDANPGDLDPGDVEPTDPDPGDLAPSDPGHEEPGPGDPGVTDEPSPSDPGPQTDEAPPVTCFSDVLGLNVNEGACVQTPSEACAMTECAWKTCTQGQMECINPALCYGPKFPHVDCATGGYSKIGVHFLNQTGGTCADTLLGACPKVVKWLVGQDNGRLVQYREDCAYVDPVVVLRVYISPGEAVYTTSDNAQTAAEDFWTRMQTKMNGAGIVPENIDWLEGPNELDNLPDWYHDYAAAEWFALFWDHLADLMHTAGYNPLVGSVAVGNPRMAGEDGPDSPNYMQPLADVMLSKTYTIGWAYHGYGHVSNLTFDEFGEEFWYSLRYRSIIAETGLEGYPVILTEAGVDNPTGWLGYGISEELFLDWLKWYDYETQENSEVVGMTLFQAGNTTDWAGFDICPVADELAAWIVSQR